ncbi:SRPBCC family protein [Jongsikchunia kroppenstedtii]|uniref:SRPBCC family protein n=1 Tax=Jongsikchunia kroppenstedtii TaxID=1121721 RepID=UPI00037C8C52|nr:SRPBCC family protein [Jongsikchunia kroppenstedtii]
MIFVSHAIPVNAAGAVHLNRNDVWDGLVRKANNALPFVPAMSDCTVTQRHSGTVFDRDIAIRGEPFTERITLEEPHRVVFTRMSGSVLGTIANEIVGDDDSMQLRFSFALVIHGVTGGSQEEADFAARMTTDYLGAVTATLAAIRKVVEEATQSA